MTKKTVENANELSKMQEKKSTVMFTYYVFLNFLLRLKDLLIWTVDSDSPGQIYYQLERSDQEYGEHLTKGLSKLSLQGTCFPNNCLEATITSFRPTNQITCQMLRMYSDSEIYSSPWWPTYQEIDFSLFKDLGHPFMVLSMAL